MKIVINKCYGGFGLSPVAIQEYLKLNGQDCFFYHKDYKTNTLKRIDVMAADNFDISLTKDYGEEIADDWKAFENDYFYGNDIQRDDKKLIEVIEKIGEGAASGKFSKLKIVEIPDDVQWELDEYDGIESVHEVHRSW